MTLQPFWLTEDLSRLEIGGTQLGSLAGDVQALVDDAVRPVRTQTTRGAELLRELRGWYTPRIEEASQAADLARALAGFLDDTWTSGIHLFVPLPGLGGFSYMHRTLSAALVRESDSERPLFGEGIYAGGVLLMLSGGPVPVFTALATLSILFGKSDGGIMHSLGEVLSSNPALSGLLTSFNQLTDLGPELWQESSRRLDEWQKTSTMGKLLTAGSGGLLQDLSRVPDPIEPASVTAGMTTEFLLRGNFEPNLLVRFNGLNWPVNGRSTNEISLILPGRLLKAGTSTFTGFTLDGLGNPGPERLLARLTILSASEDETADEEQSIFDRWTAKSTGTSVNSMFAGMENMVRKAVNALDNVGTLIDEGGDAVEAGLTTALNATIMSAERLANVTDAIGAAAGSLIRDLTELSVATLFIPPSKGGIHQLDFALGQGLSSHALNHPNIEDDAVVAGVFLCAGAPTSQEVKIALKVFGASLGLRALQDIP